MAESPGGSNQQIVDLDDLGTEKAVYSNTGQHRYTIKVGNSNDGSSSSDVSNNVTNVGMGATRGAIGIFKETQRSNLQKDTVPNVYSRSVVESIGAFDQKQERILSTGPLRPTHVEHVDIDSDTGKWENKGALKSENDQSASFKPDTATAFTKLRLRGFNPGVPANAKVRGFTVTIKRKKVMASGDIQEDAGTPLIEESVKLSFDKWKFVSIE